MKLYEITEEQNKIEELLLSVMDNETGEIKEDDLFLIEELEKEIKIQLKNKATGIVKVINTLSSNLAAIDNEIKRLNCLKKKYKNTEAGIKQYLKFQMEGIGKTKIETSLGVISIRKTPEKVIIDSEEHIPSEFIVIKQTEAIDKISIKKLLKEGSVIKGAHLESGTTISIK